MSLAYVLAVVAATAPVHEITGRVDSVRDRKPVQDAVVVLQCTCLDATRETLTDVDGRYRFRGLRAGTYSIDVLRGHAHVTRVVTVGLAK